mgnify:FL=1
MGMTYIFICEWCGFSNDKELIENEYRSYQCSCCSMSDIDFEENENFELWRGYP